MLLDPRRPCASRAAGSAYYPASPIWSARAVVMWVPMSGRIGDRTSTSGTYIATQLTARKLTAKDVTPKKAKSKVQRAGKSAKKPAAKKKRQPEITERRQVAEMLVETTIIDVIEEPTPGVVAVSAEIIAPWPTPPCDVTFWHSIREVANSEPVILIGGFCPCARRGSISDW